MSTTRRDDNGHAYDADILDLTGITQPDTPELESAKDVTLPSVAREDHDPLDPHPEVPTPLDMVTALSPADRVRRVERLSEMAYDRYYEALEVHCKDKEVAATCILFSGGKDSSTIATLFRPVATHIVHAHTGTGIQATRDFVAQVAEQWGLPLVMEKSNDDYFDIVRGLVKTKKGDPVWSGGFPGPGAHGVMYQRLKERALDKARHTLGIANSRKKRAVWIAGRRRPESQRRATVPHYEADGSVIWVSPLAVWHKADLLTLRLTRGDEVPVNPVADQLGMSGECGCLANASPGEREKWFAEYPDDPFLKRVLEVEAEIADRDDIPPLRKKWGWGGVRDDGSERGEGGRLCGRDCGIDPLLDMMDPLFAATPDDLTLAA